MNQSIPESGELDNLINELRNSVSYSESASLSNIIACFRYFSDKQISNLATAYLNNPEIYGFYIALPLVGRILKKNIDKINPKLKQLFGS